MPIPDRKKPKPPEKHRDWHDRIGTIGIPLTFVAAVIAAIFTGSQWQTAEKTRIGDQRAWLAATGVQFENYQSEPVEGGPINFVVSVQNVGHSPALDIGDNEVLAYFDRQNFIRRPRGGDLVQAPEFPEEMVPMGMRNPACDKVHMINGGITVFPILNPIDLHRSRPLGTSRETITSWKEVLIIY